MPEAVKPTTNGQNTTEFKVQQSANLWGNVGLILGAVVAIGPQLLPILPADSKWAMGVGAIISVASLVYKTLIDLGFVKGRTDVKVAQQLAIGQANGSTSNVTVTQEK